MNKRIILLPDGAESGTAKYRLLEPASVLLSQGADIVVDHIGPTVYWDKKWFGADEGVEAPSDREIMDMADYDADVVVIQRPCRHKWAKVIPFLKAQGIRVVIDVDDRFDQIHRQHVGWKNFDPQFSPGNNYLWLAQACQKVDLVTASTPELLNHYGFGHGTVLPNYVPSRYLSIEGYRPATVGWSGSIETHPTDLQVTRGAVQEALDAFGWTFHVVGTGKGVRSAMGLDMEPTATGWVPFDDYAQEMARMAIGVVPLDDTVFNASKSRLKGAELAAVGVPVVMSPTPDNIRLNKLGVGLLANTSQKWAKHLKALMRNREYRSHLAGTGRSVMSTQTYEIHADQFLAAWEGK